MTSAESPMKITAIAPWFGGKRTLAPRIVAELGPHSAYWEPFCGSMAVLLAKPPATMETVNDLHGDLINLARVIQHQTAGPRLYRRLRRVLMSEKFFDECGSRIREHKPPQGLDEYRAFDYFVTAWFGRNGVAGTSNYNSHFCRRYTKNGGHAAKRWASAVDSIPAWRRRMRQITILSDDAFKLIERIEDAKGTVVYADPPYVAKGAKYLHDFDGIDHTRLARLLSRFTATRVVVSYYDHPEVRRLYADWTFVECHTTKALVSSGQRDQRGKAEVAPEVLIINGPSLTPGPTEPTP